VHVFAEIARDFARSRTWADRWRVVFGHPGWRPAYLASADASSSAVSGSTPKPVSQVKFDPPVARPVVAYAVGQFVVTLLASIRILAVSRTLALHQNLALVFYVALALNDVGALFEGKRWAFTLEAARLVTSLAVAAVLGGTGGVPLPFAVGGAAYAAVSLAMLGWARRYADEPEPVVLTPSIG
jgi:alkylglycerol monooxygenase